ncbi:MAG: two-component system, LytTR family, sensor kinase [Sphingomonadales bacterium]|jgi:signal transduction histidine kinase|nr:two-component system, LytTR family, sensor kinase [Sphingomonadales bacterium]
MGDSRKDWSGADSAPLLGEADASGYRRPLPGFSTNARGLSANRSGTEGFWNAPRLTGSMDRTLSEGESRRLPDLGIALKSIIAFWLLYMALITLRAIVVQYPDFLPMLARRACVVLAGIVLTFLVYLAMRPVANKGLNAKAALAALLCLPASILFSATNYYVFYIYAPLDAVKMEQERNAMGWSPLEMATRSILETSLSWYFVFAAWAAFYVAMSYAKQLRAADRHGAMLAREAQEAQLRALRYQINPHFLFNTLNSLSSLILSKRTDTAERMLMNLSTFFRATLSADPTADVSLDEEIRLQRLYLDIEQIRFPDRLAVEIDVPDALLSARVPVLILQPIVENAVKYGVAKSRGAVTVRISAYEEAGRLHIKVKDDGEAASAEDEGGSTGVGLRNVCDRLATRYGPRSGCLAGADPDGGYTVHLYMPAVKDG